MKHCTNCQRPLQREITVNGLTHDLKSRKLCLVCSPFKVKPHSKRFSDEKDRLKFNEYCATYQHKKYIERKTALVLLKGGKCSKCGYDRNLAVLSFHHRDPSTKKINLTRREVSGTKWEKLVEEIAKCELVCCNCHYEEHHPHYNYWKP